MCKYFAFFALRLLNLNIKFRFLIFVFSWFDKFYAVKRDSTHVRKNSNSLSYHFSDSMHPVSHFPARLFPLSDLPGFAGPCLPLINQKNPRQPAREARAKPSLSGMKEGSRVSLFVEGHSFRLFGALCDSWQLLPTEVSYTIRVRRSFAVKHVSRFLAGVPLVMFTTNATWL